MRCEEYFARGGLWVGHDGNRAVDKWSFTVDECAGRERCSGEEAFAGLVLPCGADLVDGWDCRCLLLSGSHLDGRGCVSA